MSRCRILLNGCDDSTEVVVNIDDAEVEFLKTIAELTVAASTYGCMPTMKVLEARDCELCMWEDPDTHRCYNEDITEEEHRRVHINHGFDCKGYNPEVWPEAIYGREEAESYDSEV